jgi:hypothetical protein
MNAKQGRSTAGSRVILWVVEIVILVVLLLIIGFLESQPFLKPIFTQPGGFFIRLFIFVGWALTSLHFNDSRSRTSF